MTITTMQGCNGYKGCTTPLVLYTPLSTEEKKWRVIEVSYSYCIPCTPRRCEDSPGRMAPRQPHRPLSDLRAPVGPVTTFGTCLGGSRHRTNDPLVESDRPGMSALGCCQRPFLAPGASAHPGAGHSGVTARRDAQRQHSYRTSLPRPGGSRTRRYRTWEGVREKVRNLIGYHPLQPHGGQHFPLLAMFGF